jgi:hypothetical protein
LDEETLAQRNRILETLVIRQRLSFTPYSGWNAEGVSISYYPLQARFGSGGWKSLCKIEFNKSNGQITREKSFPNDKIDEETEKRLTDNKEVALILRYITICLSKYKDAYASNHRYHDNDRRMYVVYEADDKIPF